MAISTHPSQNPGGDIRKFLTFCLGTEHYGMEILRVREIIGLIPITPLPRAPDFVKGVMNLRGRIIPVVDLRRRLNLPDAATTKETCIIVVDTDQGEGERQLTGVIVDSVREVQDIAAESIERAPDCGLSVPLGSIQGLAKTKERVVVLLDMREILAVRTAMHDDVLEPTRMRHAA